MRIAIGSDSASELTEALKTELERRGHTLSIYGPLVRGEAERDSALLGHHAGQGLEHLVPRLYHHRVLRLVEPAHFERARELPEPGRAGVGGR